MIAFPKPKTVKLSQYEKMLGRAKTKRKEMEEHPLSKRWIGISGNTLKFAPLKPKKATPKQKRVKLPSIPKLIRKSDSIFSKWIRTRDGFRCVLQGPKCHGAIQCGHLIKRGKKSVRWSEINCHALCSYHNFLDNMEPQHYVSWFIRNYGALPYQDLVEKSRGVFKPSREYLLSIINKYSV